jgi:FAD synthetase
VTMKTLMVFGTFDIFHPGHRSFLRQAKKHGDFLIVVVARDKTVTNVKKQKPVNNEQQRLENIKKSKLADEVILGNVGNKYTVIKKYKPNIICLGYDQKFFVRGLKQKIRDFGLKTKTIKLKPHKTEIYKSSKLKS